MKLNAKMVMVACFSSALLVGCSGSGGSEDGGAGDGGGDAGHAGHDAGQDAGPNDCTVSADGGNGGSNPCDSTQYCNTTTGACVKRCDATTNPTVCTTDQACDVGTGMCIAACDAATNPTVCTGGDVCNATSGLCETPCANATCLANTPKELCNPDTNDCDDPTAATSCTFATTNNVTASTGGPIVYDAVAEDGNSSDDSTNCPGGGTAVFIIYSYMDAEGNAETSDTCAFTPATDSAFWQYNTNAVAGVQGCANQESDQMLGSTAATATSGRYKVPLCFMTSRPADFVFQVRDQAGNKSNPVCVSLPAMM